MNQLILCLCKHLASGWEPMRCSKDCTLSNHTHKHTHTHTQTDRVDLSCVKACAVPNASYIQLTTK